MKSFRDVSELAGITFVDIDETLMYTSAKILVKKNGETIKELSNSEYNTYKLGKEEAFDFSQFRDSQFFRETSVPNKNMIDKVNEIVRRIELSNRGSKFSEVHMLTARGKFKKMQPFFDTFRDHGMKIDEVGFIPVGDTDEAPASAKQRVIRDYLKSGKFGRVRLYDDSKTNLKAFLDLQKEFPEIVFMAYWIDHSGKSKKYA